MKTKKIKVNMVDDNGNGYSKEIELFQSKYHQVLVSQQRDGYRYSKEWIFDNEDDANNKCSHILSSWTDPPIDKRNDDHIYREHLWLPVTDEVN